MKKCSPDQEPADWIYYQLRRNKASAAEVGRKMEPPVSKRLVAYVINGQGAQQRVPEATVQRVQAAVAAVLDMNREEVCQRAASAGQGEGE